MHTQSKLKVDTDPTATLLLSHQGTKVEKFTEVANTLMARDYKGFGNQPMNAVMEVPPPLGDEIESEYVGIGVHPISKKLEFDGWKDANCPTLLATDWKCPKTILLKEKEQ